MYDNNVETAADKMITVQTCMARCSAKENLYTTVHVVNYIIDYTIDYPNILSTTPTLTTPNTPTPTNSLIKIMAFMDMCSAKGNLLYHCLWGQLSTTFSNATDETKWATPSCSRPQPATDNIVSQYIKLTDRYPTASMAVPTHCLIATKRCTVGRKRTWLQHALIYAATEDIISSKKDICYYVIIITSSYSSMWIIIDC